MVLGCIDIGTNTTRLLVAEARPGGDLRPLVNERVFTRIGGSLLPDGSIPAEKIAETAAVARDQARTAQGAGAERVAAVATAAIREAPNRAELARAVEEGGGMPLWVLSADEEAELSFVGATRTMQPTPEGAVAVADIGGGSTELAIGRAAGGMAWSRSFRIGSGLLADAHLLSDPPNTEEVAEARTHAEEAFADLAPPAVDSAVAVGGTAASLSRLVAGDLGSGALDRGLELLCSARIQEVAGRFGLDPERVRLLPGGILVMKALAERLGLPFQIASGGLREGVVLELIERAEGPAGA